MISARVTVVVSSSLVASLAQRLVRQLCTYCKVISADGTASPKKCDRCRQSGFRGRIGLFELLVTNDRIRSLIQSRENATTIRQAALESDMTLLFVDGQSKIQQGRTTLEEVLRVTSLQTVIG